MVEYTQDFFFKYISGFDLKTFEGMDQYSSPELVNIPETIVFIDDRKNGPGPNAMGFHYAKACKPFFKNSLHITTSSMKDKNIQIIMQSEKTLVIFVECLNFAPYPTIDTFFSSLMKKFMLGKNTPFGFLWYGSCYRLTNVFMMQVLDMKIFDFLIRHRRYVNSRSPIRMCATEDLELVDLESKYVYQPYDFAEKEVDKSNLEQRVIHITTEKSKTNIGKGTNHVIECFKQLNMQTKIVDFGTPHDKVIEEFKNSTIHLLTMTELDAGTGYAAIEGIDNGCVSISRCPQIFAKTKSETLHINNEIEAIELINVLSKNEEQMKNIRKIQRYWAKCNFSYDAVGRNVYKYILQMVRK